MKVEVDAPAVWAPVWAPVPYNSYGLFGHKATLEEEDKTSELRSRVKVEVVPNTVFKVSEDVKQHSAELK